MINDNHEKKGTKIQQLVTKLIVLNPPYFGTKSDYESISKFKNKLIFIEKEKNNQSIDNYIPCLFYRNPNSSNYLIYFHGNSEHIFQIEYYGLDFRSYLDMNVILVEYPGYSIYQSKKIESSLIYSDALIVCNWLKNKFKINNEQIYICGRSLGTSVAIYLSSKIQPKALFLISAFTSIKDIGKDYNASIFLEQIFNSYKYIINIKSPILFIHGKKDNLIKFEHSVELFLEINKLNKNVDLKLNPEMTHNDFSLKTDIIDPIINFIDRFNLRSKETINELSENELKDLYKMPLSIVQIIESKLFDIDYFIFNNKIDIKNAIFFMKSIENNIIFASGSKILIYNQRNYTLDEEIQLRIDNPNKEIKSLFQMNNKNIICGINSGDIFIYGKNSDSEDIFNDLEEEYCEIKHITLNGELFKMDKFLPNKICVLTQNSLNFFDEDFQEKKSITLNQLYSNFIQISDNKIAMLSYDHLAIFEIKENKLEEIHRYTNIESNYFKNILSSTNKNIIIGGKNCLYFLEYDGSKKTSQFNINGEINYISKIHDEFFLASTKDGKILQIHFNKDNQLDIKEKKFYNTQINSLFLKNYKTILFTDDNSIQIWNIKKKEDCQIF